MSCCWIQREGPVSGAPASDDKEQWSSITTLLITWVIGRWSAVLPNDWLYSIPDRPPLLFLNTASRNKGHLLFSNQTYRHNRGAKPYPPYKIPTQDAESKHFPILLSLCVTRFPGWLVSKWKLLLFPLKDYHAPGGKKTSWWMAKVAAEPS